MMTVIVDGEIQTGDVELPDGDYILKDGKGWFTVADKSVRIRVNGKGRLTVEVFDLGEEMHDPLNSMEVD